VHKKQLAKLIRIIFAIILFFGVCSLKNKADSAEVIPVWSIGVLGGQYFYEGETSALTANLSLDISPAVKFSDKFTLIPTYNSNYQGTQSVEELAGGGTLFQDSFSNGITVKGVYKFSSSLNLKTSAGYSRELLRETKDEEYGDGLFDYHKVKGGLEGEYKFTEYSDIRLGYDYFTLRFPNYQSLESSQDSTLSRELVGENVLDTKNHLITLAGGMPVYKIVRWKISGYLMKTSYDDQPIVNSAGSLTDTLRSDDLLSVTVSLGMPIVNSKNFKMIGEAGYGVSSLDSDQSHYDARKTVFTADYYDYDQNTVSVNFTSALGDSKTPWIMSLVFQRSKRDYLERLVQDPDGNYITGEKTYVKQESLSYGTSYPLTENFSLKFLSTLSWNNSNMQYEKVYRYHYKNANYMFGFSYEY